MKQLILSLLVLCVFVSCDKESEKLNPIEELSSEIMKTEDFIRMQQFRTQLYANQLNYLMSLDDKVRSNLQEHYKVKGNFVKSLGYNSSQELSFVIRQEYGESLSNLRYKFNNHNTQIFLNGLSNASKIYLNDKLKEVILNSYNSLLKAPPSCWYTCMNGWNACDNGVWDAFDGDWIQCNGDYGCQMIAINNAGFGIEGCGMEAQGCFDDC